MFCDVLDVKHCALQLAYRFVVVLMGFGQIHSREGAVLVFKRVSWVYCWSFCVTLRVVGVDSFCL